MNRPFALISCLMLIFLSLSCQETDPEPDVKPDLPNPGQINDQFELGRALFYDKQLSADNSISCASCHKQEFGFADNVAFSKGIGGSLTSRNSMPIQNLSIAPSVSFDSTEMVTDTLPPTPLFWDGREENILTMVLMPFTDSHEHGLSSLAALKTKVRSLPYYAEAFEAVYGSREISVDLIAHSLVGFVSNIVTANTRLDNFQTTGQGLSIQELEGMTLFFEKYDCNACHQVDNPSGYLAVSDGFSNIGLELVSNDQGRFQATGQQSDIGKFKIPSLRNVAHTAPYMHDGRFQTLDSVIEHYSIGLLADPNLDTLLQDENGDPLVLNISKEEKEAIVAFLGTLTDENILTNPNFANPFVD